jgi:MoxR-like ATPase
MSPRACQHLTRAAQAMALLAGREYVLPEDVRGMAVHVLKHRLIPSTQARLGGGTAESVIHDIVKDVTMPTGLT